jgi:hypothetical protein
MDLMMGATTTDGGQINTGTTDMLGDLLGTGMTTTAPMGGSNDLLGAMGGGAMPGMNDMLGMG